MQSPISFTQLTLAATNIEQMAAFYNAVLFTNFRKIKHGEHTLYEGFLVNIPLLLCPNAIAGVVAEQSRLQFHVCVPDLGRALEKVVEHGGTIVTPPSAGGIKAAIVADPDGNSLELIQE